MGSAVWSRSALCNFYAFAFSSFLILSSHLLCRSSLKARLNYAGPSALKCVYPQAEDYRSLSVVEGNNTKASLVLAFFVDAA